MKFNFLLFGLLVFYCITLEAQDTLHWEYKKIEDISDVYKKKQSFDVFALKNDHFIEVGDTLVVGFPASSAQTITTMPGMGDTQFQNNVYSSLTTEWKNIFSPPIQLSAGFDGSKMIVEDIQIYYSKLKGEYLPIDIFLVEFTHVNGFKYNVLGMQSAIESGEVIVPNGPLSKEQALSKLKEAKELLDLELISEQKYDSLKKEMAPIILKEN